MMDPMALDAITGRQIEEVVPLVDERIMNTVIGRPVATGRTIALTIAAGTGRAIALATDRSPGAVGGGVSLLL
jgi:hypothetical protein